MLRSLRNLFAVAIALLASASPGVAQQVADSTFRPAVSRPAFPFKHPRVLFDEAHNNFHTTTGRYAPFVKLLEADGCRVLPNQLPLTKRSRLQGYDVLAIVNALDLDADADHPARPAFLEKECQIIQQWVHDGGSLLLIADHAPFGAAAEPLSLKFGVNMSKGYTVDTLHTDVESRNPGVLVYTRESGTLFDHPVTLGRDSTERVNRVIAFTGQSLSVPPGATAFMKLSESAEDIPATMSQWQGSGPLPPGKSAAGHAQGLAFTHGKGRVIMLGEAAMLSAQILYNRNADQPAEPFRMGMNRPGIDNQKLALNLVHWLARLLEEDVRIPSARSRPGRR